MHSTAFAAGYYQPPSGFGRRVESLQIRTIDDLLHGRGFDFPLYGANISYTQAERMQADGQQGSMEL